MEHGAWFIPRYVLNRPYDHHLTRLAERLPYRLHMFLFLHLLVLEYKRMGSHSVNCCRLSNNWLMFTFGNS